MSKGLRTVGYECPECITLSPSPDTEANDFAPFSGKVFVSAQSVRSKGTDAAALLQHLLATPGPGQILDRGASLTAFDRQTVTINGKPAIRLKTLGEFGVVNHLLAVMGDERALVLRGRGDGRVFDAIAETLKVQ